MKKITSKCVKYQCVYAKDKNTIQKGFESSSIEESIKKFESSNNFNDCTLVQINEITTEETIIEIPFK